MGGDYPRASPLTKFRPRRPPLLHLEAQKGCQPPLPSGACVGQRGRGIRDGCGPFSRGIAGSRSAPHAPPSCDGATATAAPPRLPPRGCRNRCPEPPFATSARNGGAADAPPTGKHHRKGGGERSTSEMSSSSRSSLVSARRPAAAGVRKSSITLFGAEVLAGFQAPPLRPVGLDFASKAGAMPRRSHRLRPPLLPQTGQTTVSPSAISPLAVASRLPSCRE